MQQSRVTGRWAQTSDINNDKTSRSLYLLRPNYDGHSQNGKPIDRKVYPDLNPIVPNIAPFYRAEGPQAYFRLQELRPSVFYVFGKESDVGPPHTCDAKMKHTGVGIGGSGGEPAGRVHRVTYQGVGHLIAMEAVSQAAGDAADWIR
ncbi:hypothetical protein LTR99_008937 [Exophiala xenobiotica]|nr:hypothetical protein LTR96_011465 [Exophiala xenobiotica]KAK5284221.1 hypothetical protein LTR14_011732 [Exophiala xenobiotica]KAK5296570.1 hypothetical protein LTR99_008937 [Exophiala xenobiotica]